MLGVLVMLNNFYHDFATAFTAIGTYVMILMVRYARERDLEHKRYVSLVFGRILHLVIIVFILLLMAGIVRSFTYEWFEWSESVGSEQVILQIVKHIVLFGLWGLLGYYWWKMYKLVKTFRKEAA